MTQRVGVAAWILATLSVAGLSCRSAATPAGMSDPSITARDEPVIMGGNAELRARVRDAIDQADDVYSSDEFWDQVIARPWLAAPAGPLMEGTAVRDILKATIPSHARRYDVTRLALGKWTLGLARGATVAETAVCGDVSIDRAHIGTLNALVNTVAHENTHTIGDGSGARGCPISNVVEPTQVVFRDDEHPIEVEVWLVSYTIGDMAECFVRSRGTDAARSFETCLDETVDSTKPRLKGQVTSRRVIECCDNAHGRARELRRQLVTKSPWCADVTCPSQG